MQRIISSVVLAVLVIGGCGKEKSLSSNDTAGKKVRYVALGSKIRGLDPGDIGDVTSSAIASQCYECLFQYHFLKRPYELIPALAAAMPEVSKNGLTYTIKIRQDIFFVDDPCFTDGKGRQVTVDDFIYAWKRIANVKYLSKNWWVFDEKVVGLDEFREYTKTCKTAKDVDYSRPVEGLKAVDKFTLQIALKKPWPQILYLLSHLPTAPMAREAVDHYGDKIINVAVGTGPFMVKSWTRGLRIELVRNPKFRKELYPSAGQPGDEEKGYLDDAGKPLPLIDGIVYDIIEEDQPRWLKFLEGETDAAGIPKDFFDKAITPSKTLQPELVKKGIKLVIQEDPSTFWFGFNMEDTVIGKNIHLRRAMSCAFDRATWIEVFTNNRGIPAKGVFPPMFKAYDKTLENPWCQYDVARGKEMLKDAEALAGKKLTVTLSLPGTDTLFRQMGTYFRKSMEKIGLGVEVEYFDWPTFQDKVKTKSTQVFAMGWVADYPDEETFLQLFYSPNASPGPNNFNYRNDAYDELYRKAAIMPDSPARTALYRKMEKLVIDECPAIFQVHGVGFVPYYRYLKNYKPHSFGYGLAKYGNIDLKLRKELIGR